MNNNNNTFLAIALSIIVIVAWQFLYISPKIEHEREIAQKQVELEASQGGQKAGGTVSGNIPQAETGGGDTAGGDTTAPSANPVPGSAALSRDAALASDARILIDSTLLAGSINLRGARIDDLQLKKYRVTSDPKSDPIILLSPRGTESAYFAEFGFVASTSSGTVPGPQTLWQADDSARLGTNSAISLNWTNDKGIRFDREIALDDAYMFTITDRITNTGSDTIDLAPYGRIARFGTPQTQNIFVLHEGLIGVWGEEGLQETDYDDIEDEKTLTTPEPVESGWLGMTDKYWAATLIPGQSFKPRFSYFDEGKPHYQTDYIGKSASIAPGGSINIKNRLFAGAKKTRLVDGYDEALGLNNFDLMIDWGWFYFITKPLFALLSWLYEHVGNFGVAILIATIIVKALFFPLANLSYASMAKMKKVQPEMMAIRERYADDKMMQQKETMALYKREKINPAAGCWPMLIQIPVFFALYKVLFVTIEMRHAPFFGWIQDLAAPDPTSVFNLFGLLPFEVSGFFVLGFWPLVMGITMFLQMQMNPAPPDATQAMIFKWMPIVFTFMLARFPAGLVLYWAWNNTLSIIQQSFIMKRHGVKIELIDNLKGMFSRKKDAPTE